MKRLLLSLGLLFGLSGFAAAQTACGGVNFTPSAGVSCLLEPTAPTYAASGYGIVPAASATDIACITGAASKVIRIQTVRVSGTAGTLVTLPVILTRHTVANTGGTAATTTALPVPFAIDGTNPAAVATTTAYTANPTVDASAAILDVQTVSFNTTAALVSGSFALFDYKERNFAQAPILRSAAQQVCVNLGGISVTTGAVAVSFYWTELAQ